MHSVILRNNQRSFFFESHSLLLFWIFLSGFFTVWRARIYPFIYFPPFLCAHVNIAAAKMGIGSIAFRRTELRESQSDIGDELDPLSQIDESLGAEREEETGQVFQVPVSF